MNKKFYFMAGLPRSGATLLSSILNQNPLIYASPDSPVCGLMNVTCDYLFNNSEQFALFPQEDAAHNILSSIITSYYANNEKQIIIDKARFWCHSSNINLINKCITQDIKIICCVRDVLEILTSYISMIRRSTDVSFVDKNLQALGVDLTDENRCDWLMKPDGLLDISIMSVRDAIKNNPQHILLIDYNDLVNNTSKQLDLIYKFLNLSNFQHNLTNIENLNRENDKLLGLPDMHYVRPIISKTSLVPTEVLSESIINKYKHISVYEN